MQPGVHQVKLTTANPTSAHAHTAVQIADHVLTDNNWWKFRLWKFKNVVLEDFLADWRFSSCQKCYAEFMY